jgi:hypothetical protein
LSSLNSSWQLELTHRLTIMWPSRSWI